MKRSQEDVLDAALAVLRRGEVASLDSVAKELDLTKAGVLHHFPSKEQLLLGVIDHTVDLWEKQLHKLSGQNPTHLERLRAYVEFTIAADFDLADLALMCDPKLYETLSSRWRERLEPWFGEDPDASEEQLAIYRAARFIADGAWFDQALGMTSFNTAQRADICAVALKLLDGVGS